MKFSQFLVSAFALMLLTNCICLRNANAEPCRSQGITVFGGVSQNTQKSSYDGEENSTNDNKSKTGVNIGAMTGVNLNENFDVRVGVGMGTKGNREAVRFTDDEINFEEGELKTNLTYLDVPIRVGYKLTENFKVTTGLQPSLLLAAKAKSDLGRNSGEMNVKDNFKSLDVSASLGVEYDFSNKLGAALVYDHGLVNVSENQFGGIKTFNRGFRLSLYYKVWP